MSDIEMNLMSGEACGGDKGAYVAKIYYVARRSIQYGQVMLGTYKDQPEFPSEDIHWTLENAQKQQNLLIEPEQVAAISILRICARKRHEDGVLLEKRLAQLERVNNYVICVQNPDIDNIDPLMIRPDNGIGKGYRGNGMSDINPLIHLPTVRSERRERITQAVKVAPQTPSMSKQPYVALHGPLRQGIERVIIQEDIL